MFLNSMDLNPIYQLVVSVVVLYATQGIKKIQAIPINDGQKIRIRTFVGVLTFVLTLVGAWVNGNLSSAITPDMIQIGVGTGISWLISHLAYKSFLNK